MMRAARPDRLARLTAIVIPLALATLGLSACGGGTPPPLAQGRWAGSVIPEGDAAHGPANEEVCVGPTHGVLTFRGRRFQFEPNEGTLVLPGFIDATGKLSASLVRPGANHQAWVATFTGAVKARRIEGLLALPGCRADVRLDHESGANTIDDLLRE